MIGEHISHYRIIEKLGQGGMGIVYKAEDTKLKRTVALKFLPPDLIRDPEAKDRFIREAQTASAMDHPNVCTIYQIDETDDGRMFIVMAYYGGESLKEKIERGPMKLEDIIDIIGQIAKGLARAHDQGIVHRDIKPANILMTHDGQVKIVDFGLAKLAGQTGLTKTGTTMGTVAYMSPEQTSGRDIDHRTDIWSVGAVLYEMVAGERAFRGDYEQAVIYSILNEEPEPVTTVRPDIPQELEWIIQKAMQKDTSQRYQTLDEMYSELVILSKGEEISRTITPPTRLKREKPRLLPAKIAVPALVLLLSVLAVLVLKPILFQRILQSEPTPIAVVSFVNMTGDSTYNYLQTVIPNLLITSLEQSTSIHVATWERMYDLLKQIGKEHVDIIDRELGYQLCRMDGIDVIVLGSFTKTGDIFVTDMKVLNVATKDLLKSAAFKGEGVASILQTQIDELAKAISRGVGVAGPESEAELQVTDVTTTSLEAYNYFLRGKENCEKFYYDDALPFLEKAVELDSTFAVAYLYMGWAYDWLNNSEGRMQAYEKARRFSHKATDKEKLYIAATYAREIERDQEKRLRILTQLVKQYPKEKRAHTDLAEYYRTRGSFAEAVREFHWALELDPNYGFAMNQLAYTYADSGNFEKAIEYFERYASLSPNDANPFDSMAELYLRMGKLDEAIEQYKVALDLKPDFGSDWSIAYIYALREDYAEALRWADQFISMAPSPGIRVQGYVWKGLYHCWQGRVKEARSDLDQAANLANVIGNESWKAHVNRAKAWMCYDQGEFDLGRDLLKHWMDFYVGYYPPYVAYFKAEYKFFQGMSELESGLIDSARFRLTEIDSLLPEIPPKVKQGVAFRHDLLRGEILLTADSLDKAILVGENASPLGMPPLMHPWNLLPYNVPFLKDVLARTYQKRGDTGKAIAEYQRLIAFDPGMVERALVHPLYHFRLAALYDAQGESDKAIQQYEMFLNAWKDADEGLPELKEARTRLDNLREASAG